MTTMSLQQITVPFHNAELYLVEHDGQPYVPMRSIVQGIGLDWKSQFVKLKQRFSTCVVEITMQILGDDQARSHTCLLLRKLPAWLYSIHANKVKPELRDTVIKYQEECDDVLWDYWTKGQAINKRQSITPEQQASLQAIVARRSGGERKAMAEMWARHNQHFKIAKYSQLLSIHFPEAISYLETMEIKAKPEQQLSMVVFEDKATYELVRKLTEAVILENDEIVPLLSAIKIIDERKYAFYAHRVVCANEAARKVSRALDFRNGLGEPLIDQSCRVIALSTGQRFVARPNWFNCEA
ncbi:phage antirepressor N-terminal domain-containing protein [Acinetobacter larvae]|nr:phage antirepressor N-terminal domain-containing protein [Acinetobacter larvae]